MQSTKSVSRVSPTYSVFLSLYYTGDICRANDATWGWKEHAWRRDTLFRQQKENYIKTISQAALQTKWETWVIFGFVFLALKDLVTVIRQANSNTLNWGQGTIKYSIDSCLIRWRNLNNEKKRHAPAEFTGNIACVISKACSPQFLFWGGWPCVWWHIHRGHKHLARVQLGKVLVVQEV